jgi:predicted transcriptional regulator
MVTQRPNRFNVLLDEEHAAKLYALAERTYLQPGALARSLLSAILDRAEVDGIAMTAAMDAIPGAWDSVRRGEDDYAAGRVVVLEDL